MLETLKLFDLSGKRALITGSSQGIGQALAQGLAGAGAAIVLNGRNDAKLQSAASDLRSGVQPYRRLHLMRPTTRQCAPPLTGSRQITVPLIS